MTDEEKESIRNEIEKRIEDAEKRLKNSLEQTGPVEPSVAIGRLTRMDAIGQKSMAEASVISSQNLITNLKYALSKLDEAGFGVCAGCKKNIPVERILAIPETRYCVNCASKK